MIWLCLWADGVANQVANPGYDSDVHSYRQETLDFASEILQLREGEGGTSNNVLITSLWDVIKPVRAFDESRRRHLFHELETYVKATAIEQDRQIRRWLPKVDDYLHIRLGTSSVGFLLTLHGMLIKIDISEQLASKMSELIFLVNLMTTITNDILSLKEEIAAGTTYSLIPIIWQDTRSLQGAINRSYRMLEDARERFDQLEYELLEEQTDMTTEVLQQFIRVGQTYCTGSLSWGLKSCSDGMTKLSGDQEGKYQVRL